MAATTVLEWKIENFSCWNEAVHGKCIKSPDFFPIIRFANMELYPRGCSGLDDHMKVSFRKLMRGFIGELAFVCPDESLIHSQHVNITEIGESVPVPSLNLKFEEVLARLRNAGQKDEITLRLGIQNNVFYEQRMCTTIGVLKVSFEIDKKTVQSVEPNPNGRTVISYLRCYPVINRGIYLNITRLPGRIQLIMYSNYMKQKSVLVECSVSVLSSDNDLVRKEVLKHLFIDPDDDVWTLSDSLTEEEFEEKGITVLLILKVFNGDIFEKYNYSVEAKDVNTDPTGEDKSSKSRVSANQPDDSVGVLTKELMSLFQNQEFSDLRLKCGDVSFHVHRAILSARSPVFKTMLSTDMKEAASSEVVIEDLDPSTLALFLTFLYTGAVEDLQSDRALNLYYVADKYQVPSLKRECVNFLGVNVSVSNVCDILSLADKHKSDDLTAVSHDFILNNFCDVLGSKEWAAFMELEPLLAAKTAVVFD